MKSSLPAPLIVSAVLVLSSWYAAAADQPAIIPDTRREFVEIRQLSNGEGAKVLRGLTEAIQRNAAAIRTYAGVWELQDRNRVAASAAAKMTTEQLPGGTEIDFMRYVRARLTVKVSRPPERLNCDFQVFTSELQPTDGGRALPTAGPLLHQKSIVTGREVYVFEPNVEHGELVDPRTGTVADHRPQAVMAGRVAFRDPIETARAQEYGAIVNPLNLQKVGRDMVEELDHFASLLDRGVSYAGDNLDGVSIPETIRGTKIEDWLQVRELKDQTGTTVWRMTIKTITPQTTASVVGTYEFDQRFGGLPTSVSVTMNGSPRQAYEWGYIPQGDAYVPNKVAIFRFSEDGAKVTFQRILTAQEFKLNESIPDSEFEWQALGLKPTERVVDRISQQVLRLDNGEFVQDRPDNPINKPASAESSSARFWALVGMNLLVLVVIAFFATRNKNRSGPVS
jgi:hypothetical protein